MTRAGEGLSLGTGRAFLALARNGCSGALCEALDGAFGHPLPVQERSALLLAGGLMQHGHQCGMVWGATLAAGAHAYRLLGGGPRAEARAIVSGGKLVEVFRAQNGHLDCVELTGLDRTTPPLRMLAYFFLQGGSVRCARRAARFAPVALALVDDTLPAADAEVLAAPVSCAAALVRRLGRPEDQAIMAAGFAGGIGLCGGGCGALAAALWIVAQRGLEAGAAKVDFRDPVAAGTIARFLAVSGGELACEKIVGRRFEGVADHARHVQGGGCGALLEALAGAVPASRAPAQAP